MTDLDFTTLLQRPESDTLDFKATGYDIKNDESSLALVKDIVCMANTPRDTESFIVTGVKKYPDGHYDLIGLQSQPDDADLQSQLADRVFPPPKFSYHAQLHNSMNFGVFQIPPVKIGPSVAVRDFGSLLRQWQVYFRRNSRNSLATPIEIVDIVRWFGGRTGSTRRASDLAVPAWQRFRNEVRDFDPAILNILVVSPGIALQQDKFAPLALVPWVTVFDFDTNSDVSGVLAGCRMVLEKRRSLHMSTLRDAPVLNINAGTYWLFCRGLAGRPETIRLGRWAEWNRAEGAALSGQIQKLAAACSPNPINLIVLWNDATLIRHLQSTLDSLIGAFGDSASVVFVATDSADYSPLAEEVGAAFVDIPTDQLCAGIESIFAGTVAEGGVRVPASSGAPIIVPVEDLRWFEEEIELVTLDKGLVPPDDGVVGKDFLKGAEISWYELGLHYDIDRDITKRVQLQLERDLEIGRASRISIYHAPGAGGTTVGRRLLWDLHTRFPCAILKHTKPRQTAERLVRLISLTGLPVLLLVDGAEVSSREMDELYDVLRSQQAAVIVLQILRRFTEQKEGSRTFYLRAELSESEALRFAHVFARENPSRQLDIQRLARSADARLRSAFYFGLYTFLEDFKGLQPFVQQHIETLSNAQKQMMGFISISHHYAQKSFPVQVFAPLLGIPANRKVEFGNLIGSGRSLLVNTTNGLWRTSHELIATELIERLLWPAVLDRRLWRQNLSSWALEFARLCRGNSVISSNDLVEIVRRTFFFRDNTELLGTERSGAKQFAQIIEDIPTREGKIELLREVTELFPDEAHFWAHLGRFYALEMKDYVQAANSIDRAIDLDPSDPVLHHMRGMAVRYQAYGAMEEGKPLEDVVPLAKSASNSFASARDRNPDDDHGFISEVQMLARLVAYAGHNHPNGPLGYLGSSNADPFLRDCLERAEGLLEAVRRHREGEGASPYEVDCRGKLDLVYGRHEQALQTWDSLLGRSDVYAPPVRRQIVWTYLARRSRNWDQLAPKEIDRIVLLLDENLTEEPANDSNLRLWVQAVRRSRTAPSLSAIIEKVANWRARSASLDAVYYLYVLYSLQAIEGVPLTYDSAIRFLDECRGMARFRRDRTKSYEWLGKGTGATRLVHHSQLGEWDTKKEFWEHTSPLQRVEGRIIKIEGFQAGEVELPSGLKAFFVPAKGGFTSKHLNRPVSFFLGFSFDGLRAWDTRELRAQAR
jgi:tetratricopeptide (TPR) repeat protein